MNSGFMLAHVTSAALVSENKVLCHPSSVDSLPTSAGQEDHVSMGPFAARKCLQVVQNVEHVLAIELLCACQALEFLRPLKSTQPLEAVYRLVRGVSPAWENDRFMSPEIEAVTALIRAGKIWDVVKPYVAQYDNEILDDPSPQTINSTGKAPVASAGRKRTQSNSQQPATKRANVGNT
ncbi:unnamed protein product [Echinostoma caproni]|uniref:Histidine ammonia-lyase n=1 Tax=Echinostoma caproni TaxID=27848 RepID=A0A3P8G3Q8_9TREM|nr:unnamed protein product [Echinostoma caproni]